MLAVGTPATAEAVSCAGGATTLTLRRPVRSATPGRSAPSLVPGGTTFGNMRAGRPNFFSRPVAQLRVSGLRHCEVEAMVNSATREPHSAQWMKSGMNSRQSAASSRSGRVCLVRQQLEQRVELHELQAGLGEDFRARHLLEGLLHHPVGAGVAVGVRLAQHFVAAGEQHVVHAPGVRADGDDGLAVFLRREGEAVLDFGPEPHDIPAERVAQVHGAVGEAVDFFEADGLAVPEAGHHAAAFSAEVNGEINARHG